ncbi:MAG: permease [Candidatus Omnitrophica bacterium]|nr:permease [Candidatus Omnitrophota bacterium]
MQIFIDFIRHVSVLWMQMAPYLLVGLTVAGVLHLFLGRDFVVRHFGKPGVRSILNATVLGIPLPVCSCGVIPLVSALRKDGAHKSSLLAFLVSTPTTGVDSILATYALMGPLFAVFRPVAAAFTGITLGVIDYLVEGGSNAAKATVAAPTPRVHVPAVRRGWRDFWRFAYVDIPRDIGKSLFIGVALGAAISVFIPADFAARYITQPWDFLFALLIGVPLYVCATASIPVAAALIGAGFSPGAALVFLIVGPATNTITLSFVRSKLGKTSFCLYVASIVLIAALCGALFNILWGWLGNNTALVTGSANHCHANYEYGAGLLLLALMLPALWHKKNCTSGVSP